MKRDCSTCICKEGSCYPSTTIFDKDKICKSYAPDYEGYITDLEKENAELKEKFKHRNCVDCSNHGINIKLIKAKKLLKTLLRLWNDVMTEETVSALIAEAEQFLKENEE